MKKFLKNFPIEIYIIFLPALVFLFIIGIYMLSRGTGYVENFFHGHFISFIIGASIIFPIIFLIVEINVVEILVMIKNRVDNSLVISFARSSLFLLVTFYVSGLAFSVATQFIFNIADPIRTAANSIMFAHLDYAIFWTYPWLALHSFITTHFAQKFIYESYFYVAVIIPVFLIMLALKNVFLFRKFFLSCFVVMVIALPFWIIFPALAPDIMYRVNILNVPVPSEIKKDLDNANFSPYSRMVLSRLEKFWVDQSKVSLPITSFPSMHSAWGVIVTVIGIELWAPLAIVLVPWLLAELTGTVLTLQHYAVDMIFGVVLSFLGLYIASYLLKLDKKNSFDEWDLFVSLRQLETTLKNISNWFRAGWKSFLKLK